MARSVIVGILIGFVLSIILGPAGIIGSLVAGLLTGVYVGGGMGRGFVAGFGVWVLHFVFYMFLIGSSLSGIFGFAGGMLVGASATAIISILWAVDILFYGVAAAIGAMLFD